MKLKFSWIPLLITTVAASAYATYSLLRHWRFASSGFDLGIFDQLLWQYHRFAVPVNTVRDIPNLLGDHFHPLLIVLTPLYWVFPHAETLLIVQAVLVASSAIPVFLFARDRLGVWPGYGMMVAYLSFWGILHGVAYDFHEVALAVPLIAWAIYFLRKEQFRYLLVCLAALLLVKEDQALLVAMFGFLLLGTKQKKLGVGVIAVSGIWLLLVTKLIVPWLSGGPYVYWSYTALGSSPLAALAYVVSHPITALKLLVSPALKRHTLWSIFSRFLVLPVGSTLLILAIPLLAARFFSSNQNFWTTDFHYTMTLSPILAMATIETLTRLKRFKYVVPVLVVALIAINLGTLSKTPHKALADPSFYGVQAEMQPGYRALALIPDDAAVAAQDAIVPHLSDREVIYGLNPSKPFPSVEYIVVSDKVSTWPFANFADVAAYAQRDGFEEIFSESGWLVYKRK